MKYAIYGIMFIAMFALIVMPSILAESNVTGSEENTTVNIVCTDSDGGRNYYVKGSAIGKSFITGEVYTASDKCNGNMLEEAFCEGIYANYIVDIPCPNGCTDGACISNAETNISESNISTDVSESNISTEIEEENGTSIILPSNVTIFDKYDPNLNNSLEGSAKGEKWLKTQIWFTFNQEKKSEMELQLARLMLIKAKIAAENNNSKAMEKALEAHQRIITKIESRTEKLDEGSKKQEGIKSYVNKVVGLEKAIAVHESRLENLQLIIEQSNLSETQIEKINEKINQSQQTIEHLQEVEAKKKEELKIKLRAVSNMSEEQIKEEIAKIENEKGFTEMNKLIAEENIKKAEKLVEYLKESKTQYGLEPYTEEELKLLNQYISSAEEKIALAKTYYNQEKYGLAISTISHLKGAGQYGERYIEKVKTHKEEGKEKTSTSIETSTEEN